MRHGLPRRGTVLILALWSLGLLTVFAVSLGTKVQQKIVLVSRIEKRTQVDYAAQAGIRKAIALLRKQLETNRKAAQKTILFNRPEFFKGAEEGMFTFEVSYMDYGSNGPEVIYGILDEERKINVNIADRGTLQNLFRAVTNLSEEAQGDLADAIIDWREFGESGAGGFLGDEYYQNLKYPYSQKKGHLETLDELLLIRGMTTAVYRQVSPYITIYGNGAVNINTAPKAVLLALGLPEETADKIVILRRGKDGREDTSDDILFPKELGGPMIQLLLRAMESEEMDYVYSLLIENKIGTTSSHYMIRSRGYVNNTQEKKDLACVFDVNSGKIKYWREY